MVESWTVPTHLRCGMISGLVQGGERDVALGDAFGLEFGGRQRTNRPEQQDLGCVDRGAGNADPRIGVGFRAQVLEQLVGVFQDLMALRRRAMGSSISRPSPPSIPKPRVKSPVASRSVPTRSGASAAQP